MMKELKVYDRTLENQSHTMDYRTGYKTKYRKNNNVCKILNHRNENIE